jgi:hypothetical protein
MSDRESSLHAEEEKHGLSEEDIREISRSACAFVESQPTVKLPFGEMPYDSKSDMMIGLHQIPDEVGKRFDAHGIAKGLVADQIRSLNQLLTTGIDPHKPFHSMPLKGAESAAAALGAAGPYAGSFVILGEVDRQLMDGIRYVLTDPSFETSIPLLAERFPEVDFIPVSSAAQRLQEVSNS